MRTAIVVLMFLCVMPYVLSLVAGFYRQKQLGKVDNKKPREQYAQLEGPGARAVAAQQNAWEALAIYSAALIAVSATNLELVLLEEMAIIVLIARLFHPVFYLADLDKLRSLAFLVGIAPCFYLFFVVISTLFAR